MEIFVFDELLGDGRTSFGHSPFHHVLYHGAGNPAHINPAMLVETGVLDGDERFLQKDWNLIDPDPVTLCRQDPACELPVTVEDTNGCVACRQGGISGDSLLGKGRSGNDQGQQKSEDGDDAPAFTKGD